MKKKSGVKGWLKTVFGAAAVSATAGLSANLALAPEKPDISQEDAEVSARALEKFRENLGNGVQFMDDAEFAIDDLLDHGHEPGSSAVSLYQYLYDMGNTIHRTNHLAYGVFLFGEASVSEDVFLEHYPTYLSHASIGRHQTVDDRQALAPGSDVFDFFGQCKLQYADTTVPGFSPEELNPVLQQITDCAISAEKAQDDMTAKSSVGGFLAGLGAFGAVAARRRRKEAEEERREIRRSRERENDGALRKAPPSKDPAL